MNGILSVDGPVGRALSRLVDLLTVSILWILCCLPIVTAGASTTALYTMTLRMVRNEEGKLSTGFFRAFRENFKNATLIYLLLTVLAAFVGLYWTAVEVMPGKAQPYFRGASLLFALVWLMEALFVYPVQARFRNTVWNIMKNAWLMAAGNLHIFFLAVLITGLPLWTLLLQTELFVRSFPVWVLLGPGVIAWLNSYLFHHCFKKYMFSEEEE